VLKAIRCEAHRKPDFANEGGTLMILVQIATALAIGAYVVLSKDAQRRRSDATPRESVQRPADHLFDRDGRPELSAPLTYASLREFRVNYLE